MNLPWLQRFDPTGPILRTYRYAGRSPIVHVCKTARRHGLWARIRGIPAGQPFTARDIDYRLPRHNIWVAIGELVRHGEVQRIRPGVYVNL